MAFEFPNLPYAYDALEPHLDAETTEIHYDRHHRTYFTKFVAAVKDTPLANKTMEQIFAEISKHPDAIKNNGGGYYNHTLYWNSMSPEGGGDPESGPLATAIESAFGSVAAMREQMSNAAVNQFGSGYAWLIYANGALKVTSTPNQVNPIMDVAEVKGHPILCLDIWEHAYYLKFKNKRPDFVETWWKVVNWRFAESQLADARKS